MISFLEQLHSGTKVTCCGVWLRGGEGSGVRNLSDRAFQRLFQHSVVSGTLAERESKEASSTLTVRPSLSCFSDKNRCTVRLQVL